MATPPVTTVTGQVPAEVFFGAFSACNCVAELYCVAFGTPLMLTTLASVKPVPFTVSVMVPPVPCVVEGTRPVMVTAPGAWLEGWLAFGVLA